MSSAFIEGRVRTTFRVVKCHRRYVVLERDDGRHFTFEVGGRFNIEIPFILFAGPQKEMNRDT